MIEVGANQGWRALRSRSAPLKISSLSWIGSDSVMVKEIQHERH